MVGHNLVILSFMRKFHFIVSTLFLLCCFGCVEQEQGIVGGKRRVLRYVSWHDQCGWKAEDYFKDSKVIKLCKAIEANDLDEMERLIKAGADVNAQGKGNMTPLLWAFPDNKLDRFKLLLKYGADPNIVFESDFNSKGYILPGWSVTHLAGSTKFTGYLEEVLQNGADLELKHEKTKAYTVDSLLHVVIKADVPDKVERIQMLIDAGADLNHIGGSDRTPTATAIARSGQYHIALMLLEAGADPTVYAERSNKRLVHAVVSEERRIRSWTKESKADYEKIVKILIDQGESLEEARKDLDRWMEWGKVFPDKFKELMDKEIAERIAKEKAKAEKKAKPEE